MRNHTRYSRDFVHSLLDLLRNILGSILKYKRDNGIAYMCTLGTPIVVSHKCENSSCRNVGSSCFLLYLAGSTCYLFSPAMTSRNPKP